MHSPRCAVGGADCLCNLLIISDLGGGYGVKSPKTVLVSNIVLNLGILAVFKYCNFFLENFIFAFETVGIHLQPATLQFILPVGISFYTFQALSYSIDVYKRKIEPTQDLVAFSAFIGFFPQLVAGPIERATNLLPQFYTKRTFDYAKSVDGLRQILWGLFKKIVIADNCAVYVNEVFADYANCSGSTLALAAVFFTFQIYGDFSGYSDIAIGTARLFGFNLMRNFNFPYFSRDIAEFWRRWHISLTTWFRDYIYIPLGGSRVSKAKIVRNTFIIFLVSGFWHGANWTFIVWGAYHAILFLPLILLGQNRKYTNTVAESRRLPNPKELFQMLLTFALVVLGWIVFRSDTIQDAWSYLSQMTSSSLFTFPKMDTKRIEALFWMLLFLFVEWLGRRDQYAIETLGVKRNRFLRRGMSVMLGVIILYYGIVGQVEDFIYFQF